MIRALALSLLVACGGDEDLAEAHYIELIEDGECDEEPDQETGRTFWYPDIPANAVCEASCCYAGETEDDWSCGQTNLGSVDGELMVACSDDCDWLEVRCIYVD